MFLKIVPENKQCQITKLESCNLHTKDIPVWNASVQKYFPYLVCIKTFSLLSAVNVFL